MWRDSNHPWRCKDAWIRSRRMRGWSCVILMTTSLRTNWRSRHVRFTWPAQLISEPKLRPLWNALDRDAEMICLIAWSPSYHRIAPLRIQYAVHQSVSPSIQRTAIHIIITSSHIGIWTTNSLHHITVKIQCALPTVIRDLAQLGLLYLDLIYYSPPRKADPAG